MTSDRARPCTVHVCLLLSVLLAGCTATAPVAEREYLDAATAATVTVGTPVLVFARERPELAVHARDYLTLVPVDVNRSGTHAQYFVGYAWSTIDKRTVADEASQARFELVADGRRIALVPHPGPLRDLGLGELPVAAPARGAALLVAPATREQQQYVADAAELRAVLVGAGTRGRFELWSR